MRKKTWIGSLLCTAAMMLALAGCAGQPAQTSSAVSQTASVQSQVSSAPEVSSAQPQEILVSAAASLTDVLKEIATQYKTVMPNVTVTFTFGASGSLQTQIEQGAPTDLFISAAAKQMDALVTKKLIDTATRKNLLINDVVLITPKDSTKGITSYEDVLTDKVSKIALGDPASVPAGQYANDVFTFLKGADKAKAKAVLGSDVRQVLTWVESGEVDCGVVYKTDAMTSEKVKVVANAPAGSHKDVVYPAAVLTGSKTPDAAKAFLDYLSTPDIQKIFEKYGFTISK